MILTNLSLALKLFEPGSLGFLMVALVAGLVLIRQRDTARLWAWSGLVIVTLLYVLLALPIGYDVLAAGLDRGYAPITTSSGREDATAIVLLAGLDVIPSVAADQKPVLPGGLVLVPNQRQLEEGKSALHEYISLLYYRLRGWLKDVPKDRG